MRVRSVIAVAGGGFFLAGCALVLGIDDVTVSADGGVGIDAGDADVTANDGSVIGNDALVIDDVNAPFVDSAIFADGPVTDCNKCTDLSVVTECALTCDEPLPVGLAVDDNEQLAYFTNLGVDAGGAVFKVFVSGGPSPMLVQDAGSTKPGDIAYSSAHKLVFYGLKAANAIARYDGGPNGVSVWEPTSATPTTLRTASGGAGAGGRVFVLSGTSLTECDVDTCSGSPPVFTGGNVADFSVEDSIGRIAWTDTGSASVYYGDLAGATSTTLATGQTGARHVAMNGGDPTTYAWSVDLAPGSAQIRNNGHGTSTTTTIFSGQSVGGMQFGDDGTLYFTDTLAGVVYARSAAGVLTIFADKEDAPGEIVVTADWVLWVSGGLTTRASGRIMRKHR